MFLAIVSSLLFRGKYHIPGSELLRSDGSWRFAPGGTFNVTVSNVKTPDTVKIFTGLLDSTDSSYLIWYSTETDYCANKTIFKYSRLFDPAVENGSWTGTIQEDVALTLWVGTCDTLTIEYDVDIEFRNPKTLLSMNEYPMVYATPIVTVILGIFLIAWFANWIGAFGFENKLHLLFTIAFVLTFTYYALCSATIVRKHNSDEPSSIYGVRKVFRVIQETVLLAVMSLASEGWYIIRPTIKVTEIIIVCILSCFVTVPAAMMDYAQLSTGGVVIVMLCFGVGGCAFYLNMLRHVKRARREVLAHLVVIQESGINPTTTPIYKKFLMFKNLAVITLSYFILLYTRSLFLSMWSFPEWIADLTYYVLLSVLTIIIGWYFRMRKENARGYYMIGEEGEEPRVFSPDDVEGMQLETDNDRQTEWREGMSLPSQPIVDFDQTAIRSPMQSENAEPEGQKLGHDVTL